MSTGIVMCSECRREVHQDGSPLPPAQHTCPTFGECWCEYPKMTWTHCEDKTPICDGGAVQYVRESGVETVGKFCGRDE